MATAQNGVSVIISVPIAGDLSAFQYYPVAVTTAGLVTTIATTATAVLGVLQNAPDNVGETIAAVCISGPSKCVVYSGAIVATDALGVGTDGIATVTTTDNRFIVGTAIDTEADTGENAIIEVMVAPRRY
jgi:hypothetical protein